jgi:hypothetical protein
LKVPAFQKNLLPPSNALALNHLNPLSGQAMRLSLCPEPPLTLKFANSVGRWKTSLGYKFSSARETGGPLKHAIPRSSSCISPAAEPPHGFDGYPVYWLGRAGSKESLDYLRPLAEANQSDALAVRATAAIGLHNDPGSRASLKDLILTVPAIKVRRAAIKGLGHIKGEAIFLADVVRKEQDLETRINAVRAIGYSNDATALAVLQSLYSSLGVKEIRKSLIDAASGNEDQAAVAAFLLRIARQDDSPELCAYATRRLSERAAHHLLQTVNEKVDINKLDFQTQLEMEKVRTASKGKPKDEAIQMLISLARTHPQVGPRVMAIISLGQYNEPQALDFFQELLGK